MKAEDIKSADDLEAWLKGLPEDQALQVAPQIAFRAAMRVLPNYISRLIKTEQDILTPLATFSCCVILVSGMNSNVRRKAPINFKAALDLVPQSDSSITGLELVDISIFAGCLRASVAALQHFSNVELEECIFSAKEAVRLAYTTTPHWLKKNNTIDHFAIQVLKANRIPWMQPSSQRPAPSSESLQTEPNWKISYGSDAEAFEAGQDVISLPLWPDGADPPAQVWKNATPLFQRHPAWSVFKDLYENALHARPQNWPLLTELAQKDEAFWTGTDTEVLDRIAEVMEGFALSATYNGERIEVNPPTQKLMLVGEGALPDHLGHYARRKMRRAIDLFSERLSNQYRPLTDAVVTVRTAIEDNENIPMELFDACASATRMVASLARSESIPRPEDDPLIGEFVQILREVAADIIANDPKSQETLARRNAIEGNNALQVNAQVINITVGQIVNVSEGALARELTLNAKDALEKNPESEDARDGAYKLSGRIIRALRVLRESAATFKEFKELYPAAIEILNNPQVQQAVQAILKYLSIG